MGQKQEKNIIVRADKPFKITGVEGQEDGITVSLLPVPAAKSQVVTVLFSPEKPGNVKKVLNIKTDSGGLKSMVRGGTGEMFQMGFSGQGYVMVQPAENVVTTGGQSAGGGGGLLGGIMGQ